MSKMITVTVSAEFLTTPTNGIAPPNPQPAKVIAPNGTNAYYITIEASKINSCYEFTAEDTPPYGHYVTSMCGVYQEPDNNKYWMIYSGDALIPTGIDTFKPEDGSCLIYKFEQLSQDQADGVRMTRK